MAKKIYAWVVVNYFRLKKYIMMGEFNKKHFYIRSDGGSLKIGMQNHEEYLNDLYKKLATFPQEDEEKFATEVLKEAIGGCGAIIFFKGKHTIRFWVTRGRLSFNFTVDKESGNKKYYLATLGLLSEFDFIRKDLEPGLFMSIDKDPKRYHYKITRGDKELLLEANFEKNITMTTAFVLRMFDEVYKENKDKLKIKVV